MRSISPDDCAEKKCNLLHNCAESRCTLGFSAIQLTLRPQMEIMDSRTAEEERIGIASEAVEAVAAAVDEAVPEVVETRLASTKEGRFPVALLTAVALCCCVGGSL